MVGGYYQHVAGRLRPHRLRLRSINPPLFPTYMFLKKEEGSLVKNAFRGAVKTGSEEGRRAVADQPGKCV